MRNSLVAKSAMTKSLPPPTKEIKSSRKTPEQPSSTKEEQDKAKETEIIAKVDTRPVTIQKYCTRHWFPRDILCEEPSDYVRHILKELAHADQLTAREMCTFLTEFNK